MFALESSPAYWTWKYFENPWGTSYSRVALDAATGTAVGFWGSSPWRFSDHGEEVEAGAYTDIMVDPEWRRSGVGLALFRATVRETHQRVQFSCGFANAMSLQVFRTFYGTRTFPVARMDRFLTLRPLSRPRRLSATRVENPAMVTMRPELVDMPSSLFPIERFDRRFSDLWYRVAPTLPLATVRDPRFLEWRYLARPAGRFAGFGLVADTRLVGYVILAVADHKGLRRGLIMDLVTDPAAGLRAARRLISHAVGACRVHGADLVTAWCPASAPLYRALLVSGFLPRWLFPLGRPNFFTYIPVTDTWRARDRGRPEHWYLTVGDSDEY